MDIKDYMQAVGRQARVASRRLATASTAEKNAALLAIAAELGLIPAALADPVRETYREFRRLQHAMRLDGISSSRVDRDAHQRRIDTVKALWQFVFDQPSRK